MPTKTINFAAVLSQNSYICWQQIDLLGQLGGYLAVKLAMKFW
jgi:hypothetical protein